MAKKLSEEELAQILKEKHPFSWYLGAFVAYLMFAVVVGLLIKVLLWSWNWLPI